MKNQAPLYENPIFFYMHIIFLSNYNRIFVFFFSLSIACSMYKWIRREPCSIPNLSNHWGTKSHAHIIHGLPGRFYRTVVHSQRSVCLLLLVSSFIFLAFFRFEDGSDLAQDSTAALGHAGSHGGNGSSILTTHTLGLHADTGNVGLACGVPHGDVLLHAARQAGVLLGRERGTGGRDAGLEAVLVDFLGLLLVRCRIWISRVVTYSDQGAGVGHGGLLLELAHDSCLDLLGGLRGSSGAGTEK